MGVNFPNAPTAGQIFNASPGVSFVYRNSKWVPAPLKTALPRNYLINPAMQVSQENGDVQTATATGISFYPADQWWAVFEMFAGGFWVQRGRTTDTGNDLIAIRCETPVPSPAADAHIQLFQYLEGQRVAEFQWGTAKAQQAIFRFNFYSNQGGTYTVQVKNITGTRTFLAMFVVPANTWRQVSTVVPGDTTGTWANDNTTGIQVGIGLAAGTTYGGGASGWQNGNKVTVAGSINGAAVAGTFLFADAGWYLDPYKTGVAPPFVVPFIGDEIRRCQRYWYRGYQLHGPIVAPDQVRGGARHPTIMRAMPSTAIVGTPRIFDLSSTPLITTASNACNELSVDVHNSVSPASLVTARAGANYWNGPDSYIAINARL
jgi:hypothetical protein